MFCNKCGNQVNPNQQYCNKCGNILVRNKQETIINNKKTVNYKNIIIPIGTIIIFILVALLFIIFYNMQDDYYFSGNIATQGQQTSEAKTTNNKKVKGKYKTTIVTDNVYSGITIKNIQDANKLIVQDSISQKQSDYPKQIIQIENDIIQKYSITAVNLKEMDVEFAKELEEVIENIYTNYPGVRGYLTNLTLTNLDMSEDGVIALFMPMFTFGTSDTSTTRPWVIKTQIQLNAKYFLNPDRIEASIETCSKTGHFPKNATKYSPVAHELGHYLSFIALLKNYSIDSITVIEDNKIEECYNAYKDFLNGDFSKKMLQEAYQNYIQDNKNIGFDEWRGKISGYALAKNESGEYIYDETIAEAFHDVYLNKEKANTVSKYIVEVLKKYIER